MIIIIKNTIFNGTLTMKSFVKSAVSNSTVLFIVFYCCWVTSGIVCVWWGEGVAGLAVVSTGIKNSTIEYLSLLSSIFFLITQKYSYTWCS